MAAHIPENKVGSANSLLNLIRRLIDLRRAHPALCNRSEFVPLYARNGGYPFVFLRRGDGETIIVAINPSDRPVEVSVPEIEGLLDGEPLGLAVLRIDGLGQEQVFPHGEIGKDPAPLGNQGHPHLDRAKRRQPTQQPRLVLMHAQVWRQVSRPWPPRSPRAGRAASSARSAA